MNLSIILVAYHGDRWLPACLESLGAASRQRMHVVLVDNSGNTILDDVDVSAFDTEILQTPHPMGFAEANNTALVRASHLEEVVLFLNQDTISPPRWVDACLAALAENADLGAVSPVIRTYDDDGWDPSFVACLSPAQHRLLEAPAPPPLLDTSIAPAPALLVRTDVLRRVGPFDPVFGSYYEDYDLCRRIRRAGYRIGFVTQARVQHYSGSTTTTPERERKRMQQIIRNRVIYRLREKEEPRWTGMLRWMGRDLPRRLARGLAGTPSSQPPLVTLRAFRDLARIAPRLVSRRTDEARWQRYLDEVGWPPSPSGALDDVPDIVHQRN